jgi:hypothetical protein
VIGWSALPAGMASSAHSSSCFPISWPSPKR